VGEGENFIRDMTLDAYAPLAYRIVDEGINNGQEEPFLKAKRSIELA